MVRANTTIITGGRIFKAGQTVTGLSKIDKEWMKKAGCITESAGGKESPVENTAQKESMANGEL